MAKWVGEPDYINSHLGDCDSPEVDALWIVIRQLPGENKAPDL